MTERPSCLARSARPARPRRAARAAGVVAALLVWGGAGTAPQAWAHTELTASDPADGGTVDQRPATVRLVFADRVTAADPAVPPLAVTVAGSDPVPVAAVVDGDTVVADLAGVELPAADQAAYPAEWEIGYRLVALDGDTFTGAITFTVAAPAPTASEASAPDSTAGGTSPETVDTPEPAAPAAPTAGGLTTAGATTTAASVTAAPGSSTPAPPTGTAGSPATTAAAAEPAGQPGGSTWWWITGAALVVIVAGAVGWSLRRRAAGRAD